jgi:capsular polysaccharide transport system ATP-binding protein
MIEFRNVSKAFDTQIGYKVIMRGVNLKLDTTHSIGVLGRNGAGKSTMLSMIAGTQDPDEGQIYRDVSISWPLGFAGSFHKNLTGAQNVRFVARIYGVDTDALLDYVAWFSELGPFLYDPVINYSSGMRARLAFGCSMGVAFDVYLVDETTSVGDDAFRRKCKAVFADRLSRSRMIMVSHSMNTLRGYCRSGVVLEHGTLTYFDDIEEAIEQHLRNMRGIQAA